MAHLHNEEIVLLVRPDRSTDQNLLHALWHYFRGALFPQSHDLLPDPTIAAVALAVVRASVEEYHPYLLADFDKEFVTTAAADPAVRDQFSDYVRLNEVGLLMGPFLRELDHIARSTRFSHDRSLVAGRIKSVADHMLSFQPVLRLNKPEDEWIYRDGDVSYGFLLVSRPADIRPGVDVYVRRAQTKIAKGVNRIYVIGRAEERDFVTEVIASLLTIRELRGVEIFSLFRDYRGDPQGVGALLGLDEFLARLQPARRVSGSVSVPALRSGSLDDGEPAVGAESPDFGSSERRDLAEVVERLVVTLSDYDGAWIPLAEFGSRLRDKLPDFDPPNYGGRNLASVLKTLGILEFDERGAGPAKSVYMRLRSTGEGDRRATGSGERAFPRAAATRSEQFHAAHPELAPLARRIHDLTGTPFLSSSTYRRILEVTADEVNRGGFQLTRVSKAVRDRCLQESAVVDRASVNFVLTGLTYAGWKPVPGVAVDADSLGRLLVKNTLNLARSAQLRLTAEEEAQIWRWLASKSSTTPGSTDVGGGPPTGSSGTG